MEYQSMEKSIIHSMKENYKYFYLLSYNRVVCYKKYLISCWTSVCNQLYLHVRRRVFLTTRNIHEVSNYENGIVLKLLKN